MFYSYDPKLSVWITLTEKWWASGSDHWPGRQRAGVNSSKAAVAYLEGTIDIDHEELASIPRPEWWSTAMTLGHLETRLHSSRLLDCPAEYKPTLITYARKIADEGFRAKAEELVKELFGPIYWYYYVCTGQLELG